MSLTAGSWRGTIPLVDRIRSCDSISYTIAPMTAPASGADDDRRHSLGLMVGSSEVNTDTGTTHPNGARGRILSCDVLNARYRSKSDVVCQLLREAILTGEMQPGQHIVVDVLAGDLGISKIPIREALSRLSAEGLVEITPHAGARVTAPPTVRELKDAYAARATLEEMAATMAAAELTDLEIRHLLRIVADDTELGLGTLDRTTYTRLNREFHQTIFAATRNQVLAEVCQGVFDRTARYRASAVAIREQHSILVEEHRLLLDALRRRDPTSAGRLARQHIENGLERLLRFLELSADGGTASQAADDCRQ